MSVPGGSPPIHSSSVTIVAASSTSASAPSGHSTSQQLLQPLGLVRHANHANHVVHHPIPTQAQIIGTGCQTVSGTVVGTGASTGTTILQGSQIIAQATPVGSTISSQGTTTVRTLPTAVRLISPINLPSHTHGHVTVPAQRAQTIGQATTTPRQITTSYHVPRGLATVAGLSVPRATVTPRVPTPTSNTGWSACSPQIRPGALVYTPKSSRPTTLQVATTQRPTTLRQATPQIGSTTTTVVARAVRPNTPSPQRTPPPQVLQTVTPVRTTKVLPIVQRNYQSAKVLGVAALGVRPTISPRAVSGTYYYEVSSGLSNTASQQNTGTSTIVPPVSLATPVISLPVSSVTNLSTTNNYATGSNVDHSRTTTSPVGPQRPSILRKRDNEGNSPVKPQWAVATSPPPSPGGSTTVSAASSPELDDEESSLPPVTLSQPQPSLPVFNNCSPRKKPRKQLLNSETRGTRGGECEFPSEGGRASSAPSPPLAAVPPPAPAPPEAEKPPRRAMLGASWRCSWRANAFHFTRPSDVKKHNEKRPTVVELAAQRQVVQKANGWKVHHLTSQMEDLIELETGVLQQATEELRILETSPQQDLHQICELLKGNIQRSKIVCEGVAEARSNVLRIFQHKAHVSDILARQADKRCFKKHRNQ